VPQAATALPATTESASPSMTRCTKAPRCEPGPGRSQSIVAMSATATTPASRATANRRVVTAMPSTPSSSSVNAGTSARIPPKSAPKAGQPSTATVTRPSPATTSTVSRRDRPASIAARAPASTSALVP